jgi:4-amino-4-deoxy-L-arabinose transferase-like glycosyltransferase
LRDEFSGLKTAAALFIISLLIYSFAYALFQPKTFFYDEGWHSLMILEFSRNPSSVMPTATGLAVDAKPPLFIWVYAAFYSVLKILPLSVELIFRLPSFIFGAFSVSLFYLVVRRMHNHETALIGSLLLLSNPLMLFASLTVMAESFSLFLMMACLLLYLEKRYLAGSLFLGLLTLTKLLYAGAPILILLAYFYKRPERNRVLISFISVPLSFLLYFLLLSNFGDSDSTLSTSRLIWRILPDFNQATAILHLAMIMTVTCPLPVIFIALLIFAAKDGSLGKYLPSILPAIVLAGLSLSNIYLFWYALLLLPGPVIFVSLYLREKLGRPMLLLAVSVFFIFGFLMFVLDGTLVPPYTGLKEIAEFSKGKQVQFAEPDAFRPNWIDPTQGDPAHPQILLEQFNPGLLFYRFNDSADYSSIRPVFLNRNETIGCSGYLIYRIGENSSAVPGCFDLLSNNSFYLIYKSRT